MTTKSKIRVNHPKDHPDVQASKDDDYKGKTLKEKKKSAKRFADTVQTIMAKKRSETEGSFRKGGRAKHNIGGRANLLEEMGRIDARRHPDAADRAEKRRVIRELNKGYNSGGVVLKGKKVGCQIK